jgi:hypothetical protein
VDEVQHAALVERVAEGIRCVFVPNPAARAVAPFMVYADSAAAVLALLAAEGRLIDPGDLQGSVGIVVRQLREARVELEKLRAERFAPGPFVLESPIGGGWAVRCLACEAGTLLGLKSRDDALLRAEMHVHVHPDAATCAWPVPS